MNYVRARLATLRDNRQRITPYAISALTIMSPALAHAQAVGGGGLLTTVITWFQTNILVGLATLAIIVLAAGMLGGRFAVGAAAVVLVALFIMANASTLVGLIPGLGG